MSCVNYDEGICTIDEEECGYEEDFERCGWYEEANLTSKRGKCYNCEKYDCECGYGFLMEAV